jgi:hypothetical protein
MTDADPIPRVAGIPTLGRLRLCSYAPPYPWPDHITPAASSRLCGSYFRAAYGVSEKMVVSVQSWFQVSSRPQVLDRRETIETSFRVRRNHTDTMLNDDLSAPRGVAKPAGVDGIMAGQGFSQTGMVTGYGR